MLLIKKVCLAAILKAAITRWHIFSINCLVTINNNNLIPSDRLIISAMIQTWYCRFTLSFVFRLFLLLMQNERTDLGFVNGDFHTIFKHTHTKPADAHKCTNTHMHTMCVCLCGSKYHTLSKCDHRAHYTFGCFSNRSTGTVRERERVQAVRER